LGIVAAAISDLREDPPDSNFLNVEQPAHVNVPTIDAGGLLDAAQEQALNQMLRNQADGLSVANALNTAINRAQGAEVAGDGNAKERQLSAAKGFALQWADILVQADSLRAQAAVILAATFGAATLTVSWEQAQQIRTQIISTGWPAEAQEIFTLFGISTQDQARFLREAKFALLDISSLTGNVVEKLRNPILREAEIELMLILREFGLG
jgi:hypothetical protein